MEEKSNKTELNFLKRKSADVSKHHQDFLGTDIPENYFAKSKLSILEKIKEEQQEVHQPKKQKVFYLRPQFQFAVAASLVIIFALTIWLQNFNSTETTELTNLESIALQDDVLLESLLVDDTNIDAFTEETLFEEVVVKAEKKAQDIDNLILESIIVEDSL